LSIRATKKKFSLWLESVWLSLQLSSSQSLWNENNNYKSNYSPLPLSNICSVYLINYTNYLHQKFIKNGKWVNK
jgi:hypothetical protein